MISFFLPFFRFSLNKFSLTRNFYFPLLLAFQDGRKLIAVSKLLVLLHLWMCIHLLHMLKFLNFEYQKF